MKYRLLYYTGLCLLLLQQAAAQGTLLVSGNISQPQICMRLQDTGRSGDSGRPCLYLLSDAGPAADPVAGRYKVNGNQLCYQPLYPLAAGQRFLLKAAGVRDTVLSVPEVVRPATALAEVKDFYPLSDSIPENILFFHIRFSQPMAEDREAWKKIAVLDGSGKLIPRTWRQRSFWLDSSRLLVLMIHPGRVKSGIRYTGPVFVSGQQYTLTVDSSLEDASGRPLRSAARHSYYVTPEQHRLLKTCSVGSELAAGTRTPLSIRFCTGVDHAAAITAIQMYDASGKQLPCRIEQDEAHNVQILPAQPWPKGKLKLVLTGELYDCAGNRMRRLFEIKHKRGFKSDTQSETIHISSR